MNLKEAFRYQNKLKELISHASMELMDDRNVTIVENTHLRKKMWSEAEDEKIVQAPDTEYPEHITELVRFQVFLMGEREKLYQAIHAAKATLSIDMDNESGLNAMRRELASRYRHMADLRASETVIANGGTGFRFNAEGNQVSYRCDVRRVTKINFDRTVVRKLAVELQKKADEVSAELDRCLINSEVNYEPVFDVNDSFDEVFSAFLDRITAA